VKKNSLKPIRLRPFALGASLFVAALATHLVACNPPASSTAKQDPRPPYIDAAPVTAKAKQAMPVYNAKALTQACETALQQARQSAAALASTDFSAQASNAFYAAWDSQGMATEDVLGPVYLQAYVHPAAEVREAGQACILEVKKFQTELFQNPALYQQVQNNLATNPHQQPTQQLREDLLHAFTHSGVTLAPAEREKVRDIIQEIDALAQQFQANLREQKNQLVFTEAEVFGLPDSWKQQTRQPDGNYVVGYDYPHYFPFMRNAQSAAARKRYYQAFTTRGGAENQTLLDQIVSLRAQLADLHGVANFASLATRNRMAKNPQTVQRFLAEVGNRVKPLEQRDLGLLTALKAKHTQNRDATLTRWDLPFYLEQARQQRFAVDQEALRAYFPTAATIRWALAINEQLFGLRIQAAEAPRWHSDVHYYDVYDNENDDYLGAIYLDLYPREGKYEHAAAFSVRSGSRRLQRRPTSVLVTNFNADGLTQNELETLLHELGHVFHGVLSQTWYGSHSGTEVKRDFVEAPSQMLELWAQRYETLSQIKNYCAQCPAVSETMVERLNAARQFGQGSFYARQHLYASFDMALAQNPNRSAQSLWAAMEAATPLGHLEGTQFPGTFAHIVGGYAAGYYGYLWSEVLAKDMQSLFGNRLMNSELGKRYRRHILEPGGELPPQILVRNFLGREPNTDAFFAQFEVQ